VEKELVPQQRNNVNTEKGETFFDKCRIPFVTFMLRSLFSCNVLIAVVTLFHCATTHKTKIVKSFVTSKSM